MKSFTMSDRLKFRVFDIKYNQMYYKAQIGNVDPLDGENYTAHTLWITPDKVDYPCKPHWTHFDEHCDMIIMQSTGMKDKKRTLIYEGDLVRNIYDNIVYLVIWDKDTAGFRLKLNHSKRMILSCSEELVETIGNIYENPTLLENEEV